MNPPASVLFVSGGTLRPSNGNHMVQYLLLLVCLCVLFDRQDGSGQLDAVERRSCAMCHGVEKTELT